MIKMHDIKLKTIYSMLKNIDEHLRDIYDKEKKDHDNTYISWRDSDEGKNEADRLTDLDNAIGGMACLLDDLGRSIGAK